MRSTQSRRGGEGLGGWGDGSACPCRPSPFLCPLLPLSGGDSPHSSISLSLLFPNVSFPSLYPSFMTFRLSPSSVPPPLLSPYFFSPSSSSSPPFPPFPSFSIPPFSIPPRSSAFSSLVPVLLPPSSPPPPLHPRPPTPHLPRAVATPNTSVCVDTTNHLTAPGLGGFSARLLCFLLVILHL